MNGWSIQECEQQFISLANQSFRPRRSIVSLPLLRPILRFFISLFADSHNNEKGIEKAMRSAFGDSKLLIDHGYAHSRGTKVGVTTTNTKHSMPYFLTNYHCQSMSYMLKRKGYEVIDSGERSIRIWEA